MKFLLGLFILLAATFGVATQASAESAHANCPHSHGAQLSKDDSTASSHAAPCHGTCPSKGTTKGQRCCGTGATCGSVSVLDSGGGTVAARPTTFRISSMIEATVLGIVPSGPPRPPRLS